MNHYRIVSVRFHDALKWELEEFRVLLSHIGTPHQAYFESQEDEVGMVVVTMTSRLFPLEIEHFLRDEHVKLHITFDKTEEECHDCQMA